MSRDEVGLGVIGCGGFGLFALAALHPGARGQARRHGRHPPAGGAGRGRRGSGSRTSTTSARSSARDDVDLVYIATPPFLHHPQALAALEAGKHVIVEKPLALTVAQADEMIAAARQRDRLLVANLMQRYNPLFDAVRRLVEAASAGRGAARLLRELRLGREPAGRTTGSGTGRKSGGIFVEHGVHFFDLFAGWLGPGRVEAAQVGVRPGTAIEEHVHCTVRYGDAALVNFYHGFHQAGRMDRQELRLVFERGDVTLYDWVPTRARIHALVDERQTRDLVRPVPRRPARRGRVLRRQGPRLPGPGQGDRRLPDHRAVVRRRPGEVAALRPSCSGRMMADQVAWIRDRNHRRVVTEANGRDSLAMACEADALAHPRPGAEPMTVRRLSTRGSCSRPEDVPAVPRRFRGRRRVQPRGGPGGGRGRAPGPRRRAAPRAAAGLHRPAALGPGRRA